MVHFNIGVCGGRSRSIINFISRKDILLKDIFYICHEKKNPKVLYTMQYVSLKFRKCKAAAI